MESKHLMLAVSLVGLVCVQACKKSTDKSTNNTSGQVKGLIYCTANGQSWNSDAPSKKYVAHFSDSFFSFDESVYGTEGNIFGDTLTLTGAKVVGSDSTQMEIEVVLTSARIGNYTIGNYPAHNAGSAYAYYYHKLGYTGAKICRTAYNVSGSLNISNYADSTGLVSGSFNLSMSPKNSGDPKTPSYTVLNGKFTDLYFKP